MHQEHNIPWSMIPRNTKFIHQHPGYTPRKTGLFLIQPPPQSQSQSQASSPGPRPRHAQGKSQQRVAADQKRQANELNHFVRRFVATIREFSETERAKFPAARSSERTYPRSGKLFSDELRETYSCFLNEKTQKIEYWIDAGVDRGDVDANGEMVTRKGYDTRHAKLAEAVKILLMSDDYKDLETLMMLATHPAVPLLDLHHLHWGHHFGFSRVMEDALHAYLFFNIIEDAGLLRDGRYKEMQAFENVMETVTQMDFPAQQIPHRRFWGIDITKGIGYSERSVVLERINKERQLGIGDEYKKLKDYMKKNFEILYRYNMVVREAGGGEPAWVEEVVRRLEEMVVGLKADRIWDDEKQDFKEPVFV